MIKNQIKLSTQQSTTVPLNPHDVQELIHGNHTNPHHILGLHKKSNRAFITLWRPQAEEVYVRLFGRVLSCERIHSSGIFQLEVPLETTHKDYQVWHDSGVCSADPYAFWPTFGELDSHLFTQGVHYKIYDKMGARVARHQGIKGVKFCVWAPNARRVSLVGDFNSWNSMTNPMRSLGACGVWELFVPGLSEGTHYKFEIKTQEGSTHLKADPYALYSQMRPQTASIVANVESYTWCDQEWMSQRRLKAGNLSQPMSIYEVHLGSWKKRNGHFVDYRTLAKELAEYCVDMGFTHVELLPIAEHPLDESWGYQVTGYYAVTSRYGTVEDFQFFVNYMHRHGIGVILDWVPGHFPTDNFSLSRFDGTALYEHSDWKEGYHPHWNTYIFNYGRHEVSNFLIANALFWFHHMHIDGLRVDAVASMLYRDYGREEGEWVPNQYGGKENLEAIEFLRHLNSVVHQQFPGVLMIAEESTSFSGVSHPVHQNGLGFDLKWNMGWMNDTLDYFKKDSLYRTYHHDQLTFGLVYAFSENFTLVMSHDEVVHGKGSLLNKMPGDTWQKFANLRLLYSYMVCQPGKHLLFMGGELAQWEEWNCSKELPWNLLQYPSHDSIRTMMKELNHLYKKTPPPYGKEILIGKDLNGLILQIVITV